MAGIQGRFTKPHFRLPRGGVIYWKYVGVISKTYGYRSHLISKPFRSKQCVLLSGVFLDAEILAKNIGRVLDERSAFLGVYFVRIA